VQIAKHLGAGRVVGAGRNEGVLEELSDLGADATVRLGGSDSDLAGAFAREAGKGGYGVVLDYLWGHPTEALLEALTGHDVTAESSRTRLVQIGEMAGPTVQLPAGALRSSGLESLGSGGGSIPHEAIFETFPKLWDLAGSGGLRVDTEPVPLSEVEGAWRRRDAGGRRLVFVP
jgi:NADPH:quinone reductase-like Zn-dependent oxidoreductase